MARKTTEKADLNGAVENRISDHLDAPEIMRPEIVAFTLNGFGSPLLQNNPVNFIGKTDDAALATKKVYVDEEEAKLRLYLDEHGNHCHPCEAFTKAMVAAVAGKKFGKMFATKAIKGAVFTTERFAILLDDKGKPATKYVIDRRPVVVGSARILRCRPSWMPWKIRLALEIDTAILSPANVKDALALAGRIVGVGDNRPEVGGDCGRFMVE